jgi:hypothetical protein
MGTEALLLNRVVRFRLGISMFIIGRSQAGSGGCGLMVSKPVIDETPAGQGTTLIDQFAKSAGPARPLPEVAFDVGHATRQLCLYPARAGYDLQEELDFLTYRAMEPNVFFSGRFLAPAMPRLEDRVIRLLTVRDEDSRRSRLRLLMPFSVERPRFRRSGRHPRLVEPVRPSRYAACRCRGALPRRSTTCWKASPRPAAGLPGVLVLPDTRIDGPVMELLRAVAVARGLPVTVSDIQQRPMLASSDDGETYLKRSISKEHLREMRRQWRRLEGAGVLVHKVARQPAEVRAGLEAFLALEAAGWKGQRRSAMVADRYRAAFAREAVTNLADNDHVRIHSLELDGKPIAILVVFVMGGEAYTWKTAYDEAFAAFSPGKLLVQKLTEQHLDDANIQRTDSCAVPDHPIMSRFWQERSTMGTMIIGLAPERDRDVRQTAKQMHLYRNTRNFARVVRDRLRAMARRNSIAR